MTSAADLLQAIADSSEQGYVWSRPTRYDPDQVSWAEEACFKLLVLMAGESPEYVHAELPDHHEKAHRVVLFMPSSILVLTVGALTGRGAGWRESSVQVVPRRNVTELKIDKVENLYEEVDAEWPGRTAAQVAVAIDGIGEVRMPSVKATAASRQGFVNLLPSLVRDLSA